MPRSPSRLLLKSKHPWNEQTSKRIASLAGKGMRSWRAWLEQRGTKSLYARPDSHNFAFDLTYGEIASILASAETQARNRPTVTKRTAKARKTRVSNGKSSQSPPRKRARTRT
jgi:hypothetical protein